MSGNGLRSCVVASVLALGLAADAAAGNLVTNGDFDADVDGWSIESGIADFVHDPLDLSSLAGSGSLRVVHTFGSSTFAVIGQCVPASPDTVYRYGAKVLLPGGQPGGQQVSPGIILFAAADPACDTILGLLDIRSRFPMPVGEVIALDGVGDPTPPGTQAVFVATRFLSDVANIEAHFDDFYVVPDGECVPDATHLCLRNGRFAVSAEWATATDSGSAQAVRLTDETGHFWFFQPANVEAIVKVINGCGVNDWFWVFAAGLTNVEVRLAVTDTATRVEKTYVNPRGTRFAPVQDTSAFATCP